MIKRVLMAFFALAVVAVVTTGCNTVRGAGEDIENTGAAIQRNL